MGRKRWNELGWVVLSVILIRISCVLFLSQWMDSLGLPVGWINFIAQFLYVIPVAVYILIRRGQNRHTFSVQKVKITTLLLMIPFYLSLLPIISFVNGVSMLFVKNVVRDVMINMTQTQSFLFSLLIIAVVPAFLEEGVYRGFVFGTIRKASVWQGVLISALLFGIMHLNVNQFLYATVIGCVMAILLEVSGSIWTTITLHFTVNASSVTMMYLMARFMPIQMRNTQGQIVANQGTTYIFLGVLFVFALIGAVCIGLLLWAISKNESREDQFSHLNPFSSRRKKDLAKQELSGGSVEDEITTSVVVESPWSIPLAIAIVLGLAMMIYLSF